MSKDDREFDNIFRKLTDYRTDQTGTEWANIDQALSTGNQGSGLPSARKYWQLSFLLLIPAIFIWKNVSEGLDQDRALQANELTIRSSANQVDKTSALEALIDPEETKRSSSTSSGTQHLHELNKIEQIEPVVLQHQEKTIPAAYTSIQPETNLSAPTNTMKALYSVVTPHPENQNDYLIVSNKTEPDSANIELEQGAKKADEQLIRKAEWSMDLAYVFGWVKPNSKDFTLLSDFKFRPGFAVNARYMIHLNKTGALQLFGGPSYRGIYKSFSFKSNSANEEVIRETSNTMSGIVHALGTALFVRIPQRNIQAGLSYHATLGNNQITKVFGSGQVDLNINRMIKDVSNVGMVTMGLSATLYTHGPTQLFQYRPIQLTVGLHRK